jgi:tetratricopeptide (TPR) repeat protein
MRQPAVLFGWLWFTGMLAPVIGIAQISHYAHADRYTYLPQVGLLIACVWLASAWAGRHGALLGAAAVAVLGACAIAGWHQTAYWQDSLTLWTHTLDCTRDNAIAHLSAGNALDQRGRTQEAIDEFQEALRINPRMADAYCNLGAAFLKQRRVQDAIEQCLQGLRIEPSNPRILFNLGNALFSAGRVDDAISEYRQALSVDPTMADAEGNLGAALVHQGLDGEGIAALEESLRLMPPYSDPAMAARLINRIKMAQAGIRYSPSR